MRFRLETAYGEPNHPLTPDDVVEYLEWCQRVRRAAR
jgi:hypothetical protein